MAEEIVLGIIITALSIGPVPTGHLGPKAILGHWERTNATDGAETGTAAQVRCIGAVMCALQAKLIDELGWEQLARGSFFHEALIPRLLDVSRIVAGKLRIQKQRESRGFVAGHALEATWPPARVKNIELTTVITPSMWMERARSGCNRSLRTS